MTDVTDGQQTYEVLRARVVDNHGLAGGTLHEIFLRDLDTGRICCTGIDAFVARMSIAARAMAGWEPARWRKGEGP